MFDMKCRCFVRGTQPKLWPLLVSLRLTLREGPSQYLLWSVCVPELSFYEFWEIISLILPEHTLALL